MKILVVSHYYLPHVGGLEIAVRNVGASIVAAGHHATLVTSASNDALSGESVEDGMRVIRVRALNALDAYFNIPFPIPSPRLIAVLWYEVKKADVVHVHDALYIPSWIAAFFAHVQKKPLITTQHVALVEHPSRFVMLMQQIVHRLCAAPIFRASTRVIAHNAVVAEFVRAWTPRVVEMRNGIDRTLFRPVHDAAEKQQLRAEFNLPDRPLVLFVGRFVPKKGMDALFAARDSAYDIVFAGSGELKPEWVAAKNVHIRGPLSQENLAKMYRATDMCVLPSRGELFTLALQEACASGLPVITTDEPAYQSYRLDRTGISLVEPRSDILKAEITRILKDSSQHARMTAYSMQLAAEWFDCTKNSALLIALYGDVSARKCVVTTSWDDGHVLDIKLASLLRRYGITGTMYLSPECREIAPELRLKREQLHELEGFEIGAHTRTHPYLPAVSLAEAEEEIVSSKKILEEWTGKPVTSFCYPKGGYTKDIEDIVQRAGFARARTVERFHLDVGHDPYAIPTSIHTYDHYSDIWNLLKFVHFNPFQFVRLYRKWDLQAMVLFDRMMEEGGIFHLWGHSWEIELNNDWDRFETVLKHIAEGKGVEYATNAVV